ncbi:hypothetical protein K435DRAFT_795907 [Dendrothele bispora CBS 962.96]|uniref:Uncharacterized protein n=1 Tax=Dendrothele bispora (strain CBS 962.96) TaxID=1314807 RepID=A0A4S8M7N0_DENBC|nr:hypothetical protein K435DRAFT_795907 [Dendrothele bispora CBS 962.96]
MAAEQYYDNLWQQWLRCSKKMEEKCGPSSMSRHIEIFKAKRSSEIWDPKCLDKIRLCDAENQGWCHWNAFTSETVREKRKNEEKLVGVVLSYFLEGIAVVQASAGSPARAYMLCCALHARPSSSNSFFAWKIHALVSRPSHWKKVFLSSDSFYSRHFPCTIDWGHCFRVLRYIINDILLKADPQKTRTTPMAGTQTSRFTDFRHIHISGLMTQQKSTLPNAYMEY